MELVRSTSGDPRTARGLVAQASPRRVRFRRIIPVLLKRSNQVVKRVDAGTDRHHVGDLRPDQAWRLDVVAVVHDVESNVSPMSMNTPAHLQWLSNDAWTRQLAEQAGEEMAARLEAYAASIGQHFTPFQTYVLRHSVFDFAEELEKHAETHSERESDALDESYRYHVTATVQKGIVLVRQAIETDKRMGAPTVRIRAGLRLPVWWEDRYQLVFQTGLMWMISPIMQSAFLGAPELGENRPWTSR